MKQLVFLGGTCGGNNWRTSLIESLTGLGVAADSLFNPVVPEWNDAAKRAEEEAKENASHFLYYLADPVQEGNPLSGYSMVEATMALYDSPETTVVVFDTAGMSGHALKAMNQSAKVLKKRFPDAKIFTDLQEATDWLATELKKPAGV